MFLSLEKINSLDEDEGAADEDSAGNSTLVNLETEDGVESQINHEDAPLLGDGASRDVTEGGLRKTSTKATQLKVYSLACVLNATALQDESMSVLLTLRLIDSRHCCGNDGSMRSVIGS